MVTKKWKIPWDMIEIIEAIQSKVQAIQFEMMHVYREANMLADYNSKSSF